MKIAVIGGTGFIGESLCRALALAGEEVFAVGRTGIAGEKKIEGVEYEGIDLDTNFSELKVVIGGVDVVVFALQPNSRRMRNILSTIQEFNNTKKIIYLSTLLVYPDSLSPQAESVHPQPLTDYEKAKCEEEKLLDEFIKKKSETNLCVARLANVYGGLKNRGVIYYLFKAILQGETFTLHGDGSQVRDCIFIQDVVELLVKLITLDQTDKKEVINVSTGTGLSILQLIDLVEGVVGKKIHVNRVPSLKEKHSIIGDNRKLISLVGRISFISAISGIRKTHTLYSQNNLFL